MRDFDVRTALRARLNQQHAGDANTRIVEEMGIWSGTVRVDLAVINGELAGFEIKSDSDTLDRLPHQADIYNRVFDRVTLVVGAKLAPKAIELVPPWWGCAIARMKGDSVHLAVRRKGRKNPSPDVNLIAQMLWKDEAIAVLAAHGLDKGWRSKKSGEICEKLVSSLSFKVLTDHVRAALKARQKLGQVVSGDLNVPIHVDADPCTGVAGRGALSDVVDSLVAPAMRDRSPFGTTHDIESVTPELLIHRTGARPLNLDPVVDQKRVAQRVLGIDGDRRGDVGRGRVRRQAAIVPKVEPVRQAKRKKRAPEV